MWTASDSYTANADTATLGFFSPDLNIHNSLMTSNKSKIPAVCHTSSMDDDKAGPTRISNLTDNNLCHGGNPEAHLKSNHNLLNCLCCFKAPTFNCSMYMHFSLAFGHLF